MDTTQPIFPQQLTASDLLTYCSSSSLTDLGRKRQRYCWGFISGVEETIRLPLHASRRYCQLNLNYSDFIENSGSSKLKINTLQVYL